MRHYKTLPIIINAIITQKIVLSLTGFDLLDLYDLGFFGLLVRVLGALRDFLDIQPSAVLCVR
jgi:hypothetical protein